MKNETFNYKEWLISNSNSLILMDEGFGKENLKKHICCIEYDECHKPVSYLCEKHRKEEELRLKKFYTNNNEDLSKLK